MNQAMTVACLGILAATPVAAQNTVNWPGFASPPWLGFTPPLSEVDAVGKFVGHL
jgi:hypothetical protein